MARGRELPPEQTVNLLRQIEMAVANCGRRWQPAEEAESPKRPTIADGDPKL